MARELAAKGQSPLPTPERGTGNGVEKNGAGARRTAERGGSKLAKQHIPRGDGRCQWCSATMK